MTWILAAKCPEVQEPNVLKMVLGRRRPRLRWQSAARSGSPSTEPISRLGLPCGRSASADVNAGVDPSWKKEEEVVRSSCLPMRCHWRLRVRTTRLRDEQGMHSKGCLHDLSVAMMLAWWCPAHPIVRRHGQLPSKK